MRSLFWILSIAVLFYACEKEEQEEPLPKYALFVSASDGGTVSTEGGLYSEGEKVTVSAILDPGYIFTGKEPVFG